MMSNALWADNSASAPTRLAARKLPGVREATEGECWRCPIETIDQGELGGLRYGDETLLGLHAVLRNQHSGERFGAQHAANPAPLPRSVDFRF